MENTRSLDSCVMQYAFNICSVLWKILTVLGVGITERDNVYEEWVDVRMMERLQYAVYSTVYRNAFIHLYF